ncbi:MAG: hypothetical protein R2860_11165 [Desulfobacterales bacterium]
MDAMTRLKKGTSAEKQMDFMVEGYIRNIEEASHVCGSHQCHCRNEGAGRAFSLHRRKGPDGTCAALILLMLGVDREPLFQIINFQTPILPIYCPKSLSSWLHTGWIGKACPYFTAPWKVSKQCWIICAKNMVRHGNYLDSRKPV